MPKAVNPACASPTPQACKAAGPLATCFPLGCRFAHRFLRERVHMCHLAMFWTDQGFGRPSAQRTSEQPSERACWQRSWWPSGHDGFCRYAVSRSTCITAFKSPLTLLEEPSRFVVLLRLVVFSSVFFLFYHNYFHDYHARVISLKPKVSCLISYY